MIKTVDLFSGCGGMSQGFMNAGFNVTAAFECWKAAIECYKANFVHDIYNADLNDYDNWSRVIKELNPDLIIGGPPCQDFSHAGKRVESTRADLTICYAKIIDNVRPKYFVMENVDRISTSKTYSIARTIYKSAGYGLCEYIVDASYCGVPQKRKRFFCIGGLNEEDDFIKPPLNSFYSNHPMTVREYFGDSAFGTEYYYRHPRNYSRRGIFSIDEPAPTVRGVNRPIPQGYPGHPNDAHVLDNNVKALTTKQRSLIQTFPPDFKWIGSKTDIEQMIGNAVPVKLAEFIANYLMKHIKDTAGLNILAG